jgi:hypothetical protein
MPLSQPIPRGRDRLFLNLVGNWWGCGMLLILPSAVAAGIVLFIAPGYTVVTNAVIESALALARLQAPPLSSLSVVVIFSAVALLPLRLALRRQW